MNTNLYKYLGFAIRKNSVVIGVDNILNYKKKFYFILISNDLSENSIKKLNDRGIVYYVIEMPHELKIKNIKAIALTDENLADAIKNNLS